MKVQLRLMISCVCGIAVAGCGGMELERAQKTTPTGAAFTKNLYDGYVDLSAGEFGEADYVDSDWFASRAISAAGDVAVEPQAIGGRNLPADRVRVLTAARERLVAALRADAGVKAPANAARAQVMFDCWMQEQEENRQPDHIAACRDGFIAAIGQVEAALKPAPAPVAAKPKPAPAVKPKPDPKSWVTYFGFDEAKLTEQAISKIAEATAYASQFDGMVVTVSGHADRAGKTDYNDKLSETRADMVAVKMMAEGVRSSAISIKAFGEGEPSIATPDGVRKAANRRVEIKVTGK